MWVLTVILLRRYQCLNFRRNFSVSYALFLLPLQPAWSSAFKHLLNLFTFFFFFAVVSFLLLFLCLKEFCLFIIFFYCLFGENKELTVCTLSVIFDQISLNFCFYKLCFMLSLLGNY